MLKDSAREAIDGLIIDDDNYDLATDILKQLYDRSDERIVSLLYGEFKRMPASDSSKESKRKTYNACERVFRQLTAAGQSLDSSSALTFDLLSKFPDTMVRSLKRHYGVTFESKLSQVRIAIEKCISENVQTSDLINDLERVRPESTEKSKPKNGPTHQTSAFGVSARGSNNRGRGFTSGQGSFQPRFRGNQTYYNSRGYGYGSRGQKFKMHSTAVGTITTVVVKVSIKVSNHGEMVKDFGQIHNVHKDSITIKVHNHSLNRLRDNAFSVWNIIRVTIVKPIQHVSNE